MMPLNSSLTCALATLTKLNGIPFMTHQAMQSQTLAMSWTGRTSPREPSIAVSLLTSVPSATGRSYECKIC